MTKPGEVVRVSGLGKKFLIRHQAERGFTTFRETMVRSAHRFASRIEGLAGGTASSRGATVEEFWALRDLNFSVSRGDVIGIIGRNGAGKSTLLKVLSRITEPTEGRVEITGRVASLLEVGTGFHQELTGRENIFLNGAILGMKQAEIRRKFDQIVDFAGVERFLDTPVKRYSSGMYTRLAFSVAAHLEPEILVIDEVLAVGDAEFQRRSLGRMKEVAEDDGRAVLFVSHNLTAVSSICNRGLFLDDGRLRYQGAVHDTIERYLSASRQGIEASSWTGSAGDDSVQVQSARVLSDYGGAAQSHEPITVELVVSLKRPLDDLVVAWELWSSKGQLLAYSGADDAASPMMQTIDPGTYKFILEIPANSLAGGAYTLALDIGYHNNRRIVQEREIELALEVENVQGLGRRFPSDHWTNIFRPAWQWSRERQPTPGNGQA